MLKHAENLVRYLWNSPTVNTWLNLVVNLGNSIILLPLVLSVFSVEEIAVFYLFSIVIGFNILFSFGFGPTISRFFAYANGGMRVEELSQLKVNEPSVMNANARSSETNWETVAVVWGASKRIYKGLAIIAFLTFGTVGSLAVAHSVNQIEGRWAGWGSWGLMIICQSLLIRFSFLRAAIAGLGGVALAARVSAICGLVAILFGGAVLYYGGGLFGYVLVRQLLLVTPLVIIFLILRKFRGGNLLQLKDSDGSQVMGVAWKSAKRAGIGHVLKFGTSYSLPLIYAQFASAAQLASYLVTYKLLQTLMQFAQAPFFAWLPSIQRLYSQGKLDQMMKQVVSSGGLSALVVTSGVILVVFWGDSAIELLDSDVGLMDSLIIFLLAIALYGEMVATQGLQLYSVSGHVVGDRASFYYMVSFIVIGIILSFLREPNLDMFIFSMAASFLFCYIPYVYYYSVSFFGRQYGLSVLGVFGPTFCVLGIGILYNINI